jgi:hypothetical protein
MKTNHQKWLDKAEAYHKARLTAQDIAGRWCNNCGHMERLHPGGGQRCQGINGSHNDPEGGEYPCNCRAFVPVSLA